MDMLVVQSPKRMGGAKHYIHRDKITNISEVCHPSTGECEGTQIGVIGGHAIVATCSADAVLAALGILSGNLTDLTE